MSLCVWAWEIKSFLVMEIRKKKERQSMVVKGKWNRLLIIRMKNRRKRGRLLHRDEIANLSPFPFNEDRVAAERPARRQRERGFLRSAFPWVYAGQEWFSEHEGEMGMCGPAVAIKRLEFVNLLLVNCYGGEKDLSSAKQKCRSRCDFISLFIYILLNLAFF